MTTSLRPGERSSCIGCHEPMTQAPPRNHMPLAALRPASTIQPPPWGIRTMGFPEVIQPILDKHCITCHDGTTGPQKAFDLVRGAAPKPKNPVRSWYELQTAYVNLRKYAKPVNLDKYITPPLSWGSRVSPLMDVLAKDHYDVKLGPDEWQTLAAWIDCNAPFLDDYRKFAVDPALRIAGGPPSEKDEKAHEKK
jgi:hypothetical protein